MSSSAIPNYTRVLFHDGEAWNVTVPELNGSTTFGETREAALAAADEMVEVIVQSMIEQGETVPSPFDDPKHVQQAS
ncbi:MAG: type II toxin-antitoxin system HicB family antitoxin [Thermoleophilia bacterium]|nr:type II toxin-antitoxin system HicB family antitoxin [Thermoleophilia bacterium]